MANNSIEIIEPLDFHPSDSPRGCLYYNTHVLTPDQQTKLNNFKINTVRNDNKYLAQHPEIRALTALMLRHILKIKPRNYIDQALAMFFYRSRIDIEDEVDQYIRQKKIATFIEETLEEAATEEESVQEMPEEYMPIKIPYVCEEEEIEETEETEETKSIESFEEFDDFIKNMLTENLLNFLEKPSTLEIPEDQESKQKTTHIDFNEIITIRNNDDVYQYDEVDGE